LKSGGLFSKWHANENRFKGVRAVRIGAAGPVACTAIAQSSTTRVRRA
jgi:hypothetical protein